MALFIRQETKQIKKSKFSKKHMKRLDKFSSTQNNSNDFGEYCNKAAFKSSNNKNESPNHIKHGEKKTKMCCRLCNADDFELFVEVLRIKVEF